MSGGPARASGTPIRDLGLTIEGTRLEPILARFLAELDATPLRRLRPCFYLSTEWGVPFETISIAIPFYLATDELAAAHLQRTGHLEGTDAADILRYLRHEMGHVVNYAYNLFADPEWVRLFGAITQPYLEQYVPRPFSPRYVRHLPGWYAQMHPDEDWAESFAVWMTPGERWREDYAAAPEALAKLEYVDRTIARLGDTDPPVTLDAKDEDVSELGMTIDELYDEAEGDGEFPPGLAGALRALAEDLAAGDEASTPFGTLLRAHEADFAANVYRWTGHFPGQTRALVRHLAALADTHGLAFAPRHENALLVATATFVTALAMSHVAHGSYQPA